MIEHKTAELSIRLHYAEASGTGPALLLLHGITSSLAYYLPLMPELAEVMHVYALDFRGHGQSGHLPNAYQVRDYAQDVHAFLQTVVGKPAVIAGHSLGGLVTAWMAAQYPEMVRGIFLEDPPMYTSLMPRAKDTHFHTYFINLRNLLAQHIASGATRDDLAAQIAQSPVPSGQTRIEAVGEDSVRHLATQLDQIDPTILDAAIDGSLTNQFDPDQFLPTISCPAHLLAGQYHLRGAMDTGDVQRVVTKIRNCTYTVLDDVGHNIHIKRPHDYLSELKHFVSSRLESA